MVVGRRGGTDECLDRIWVGLSLFEQLLDGTGKQITDTASLLRTEDVACLHANALHNPLIAGIYKTRQFLVVEDVVRHIPTDTGYHCIYLFHYTDIRKTRK